MLKHIKTKLGINELKLGNIELFYKLNTKVPPIVQDTLIHQHLHASRADFSLNLNMIVMVFLNNHHFEFEGGRFIFNMNSDISHNLPENQKGSLTIDLKLGRVLYFTTGNENSFQLEQVYDGDSYAFITSIECA